MIRFVLRNRWAVIAGAAIVVIVTAICRGRALGSEFMPPLDEGTILLYMPTTLPGHHRSRRREKMLQDQDRDPQDVPRSRARVRQGGARGDRHRSRAGLDMFETTITLKPRERVAAGMTSEQLIAQMDSAVPDAGHDQFLDDADPRRGSTCSPPASARRSASRCSGRTSRRSSGSASRSRQAVQAVPGTRSAFAERAMSGYYLDIDIDRAAAARHGLNVGDVQSVIASAIGGMVVTQTVEGRERYGVRVRYMQDFRNTPEQLATVLVPVSHSGDAASTAPGVYGASEVRGAWHPAGVAQVPLGEIATIRKVAGPMVVRTEDASPTAWVYVDVTGRDIGSYVRDAQAMVQRMVVLPQGYSVVWSGQYEYMQRARERMKIVVPATLADDLPAAVLQLQSVGESLIVMLSLPFALVGGVWFMWLLDYNWSSRWRSGSSRWPGWRRKPGW